MKVKLFVALLIFPTLVSAFQTELKGEYHRTDYEGDQEFSGTVIMMKHYFNPVEMGSAPYHEAGFLDRSSSVEVAFGRSKFVISNNVSLDGLLYGADIIVMNKGSDYYLNGGFLFSEHETNTTPSIEMELYSFHIEPGYFVNDFTLVSLSFDKTDVNVLDSTTERTEIGLKAKSVFNNLNLEGEIVKINDEGDGNDETNTELSFSVDYYVTKKASLGFGISSNSGDDEDNEGETFVVKSVVYANEKIGLGFEYSRFISSAGDDNSITIGASVRF